MDIEIENKDNKITYNVPNEITFQNDCKSLIYSKAETPSLSKNIYYNNKYEFSKMDIIQDKIP